MAGMEGALVVYVNGDAWWRWLKEGCGENDPMTQKNEVYLRMRHIGQDCAGGDYTSVTLPGMPKRLLSTVVGRESHLGLVIGMDLLS